MDAANNTKTTKRVVGRPFPKGVSGNPNGRPHNPISITHHLREVLAETDEEGVSKARRLAEKAVEWAIKGDNIAAFREILERVDGKVSQPIDVKTEAERMFLERLGRPPTPEERQRVINLAEERERRAG